jgi:hypothetical protein
MEHSPAWEANSSSGSLKLFLDFMEPKGSLPCSQVPTTCPCPEPVHTLPTYFLNIHYDILSFMPVFQVASFNQVSLRKPCMYLSSPPYMPHALPISLFLIWSPKSYLMRATNHKVCHYVIYSTPVISSFLDPSIFPAPHCQTPSAYVSSSV